MRLHEDDSIFSDVIAATSESFTIPEEQVEKDYFVSYLLEYLAKDVPQIVFKGGTSLSKCYGVVKRFSEDIDIHYAANKKPSQGEKRQLKEGIIQAIENARLKHLNPESIQSRRDHNNYEVEFPQIIDQTDAVKNHLSIETFVPIKAFPTEKMQVSSYILDFLESENETEVINTYHLQSFNIHVQRIDRTFIDKLFAICDYYEQQTFTRHSRHLYDLHKIIESFTFHKAGFQLLFKQVRAERYKRPNINISAKPNYDIAKTIETILNDDVYQEDYQDITRTLLFEDVSYDAVKRNLLQFLEQGLIPK
ncbi:nucleotidyl transferase AbiEii/AbiGii toxin family protein [Lentibacillus sp. CBA3610]|uniref:nucleotidyl transferase AbiEii/AbiGii toxin family protein n=1 Tax=Lentibacillus sp. CBA3610 TaxID=2518176 RepID=UPI001595FBCB|nr:nucleotidyl transferase AbiEii/AbiGii toxin family protein [Lentibacillus sp. CBA3610]